MGMDGRENFTFHFVRFWFSLLCTIHMHFLKIDNNNNKLVGN